MKEEQREQREQRGQQQLLLLLLSLLPRPRPRAALPERKTLVSSFWTGRSSPGTLQEPRGRPQLKLRVFCVCVCVIE